MSTTENMTFKPQPARIMASYGTGKFLAEFILGAFGALVFKYYETNILLDVDLVAIAIIIYSVWNAINDPLVGHFTAKPTFLSKKLGRRFPWILFGSILWAVSFILVFTVPKIWDPVEDQWLVFAWMVFFTCLFDFLYSIWDVNFQSIFPDKFRGAKERGKAAGIGTVIGVVGIAAGALVWTFIIDFDTDLVTQNAAFITNAYVYAGVGLVSILLFLPGVKEEKHMIDRYMKEVEADVKGPTFFQQFGMVMKERNFMAFILFYFLYQAAMMCLTASIPYLVDYILPTGSSTTFIFAAMLIGALIAVPSWLFLRKKAKSNQKMLVYSAIWMAVCMIPMTFLNTELGFIITVGLWGFGFGGFWMLMGPALADTIDEIVVKNKKRDDGVFMGFRAFFGRLSWAVQAGTFWLVHQLTEFNPVPEAVQTPDARLGIHLHMGAIPAVFLIIGVIIFLAINTLTPRKVEENHLKLKKLDL